MTDPTPANVTAADTMPSDVALRSDQRERLPSPERMELEQALRHLHAGRGLVVRTADLLANTLRSAAALGIRRLGSSQELTRRMRGLAEVFCRTSPSALC
jgi:hypothetical protein